ncbi:hypothetical protein BRIN106911_14265 [Brevibacillus invocatus]
MTRSTLCLMSDSMADHHRLDSKDIANGNETWCSPCEAVCFQAVASDLQRTQSLPRCLAVAAKVDDLNILMLICCSLHFLLHVLRYSSKKYPTFQWNTLPPPSGELNIGQLCSPNKEISDPCAPGPSVKGRTRSTASSDAWL